MIAYYLLNYSRKNWKEKLISQQDYQQAKTKYFQQIKPKKVKYWNNFLENVVSKEIFKAFNYTKFNKVEKLPIIKYSNNNQEKTAIIFNQKCEAFMKVFFINPPQIESVKWDNYKKSNWDWPEINRDEIKEAIFSSSIKSAAGSNGISYLIL